MTAPARQSCRAIEKERRAALAAKVPSPPTLDEIFARNRAEKARCDATLDLFASKKLRRRTKGKA